MPEAFCGCAPVLVIGGLHLHCPTLCGDMYIFGNTRRVDGRLTAGDRLHSIHFGKENTATMRKVAVTHGE